MVFAIDVDETLKPCIFPAARSVGIDPSRITSWDLYQTDLSDAEITILMEEMNKPEFILAQQPYPGARDFIKSLKYGLGFDVVIASGVAPGMMTTRATQLQSEFPEIEIRNIMLGCRKDLLTVDFLLDDNPRYLGGPGVKHNILKAQPYNAENGEYVRLFDYDEILRHVEKAVNSEKR